MLHFLIIKGLIHKVKIGHINANAEEKDQQKPPRPLIAAKSNPCIHGMFVANQRGCDVYSHGKPQLRPRKRVETWVDEQVNEQSDLSSLRNCVIPFMKATNSKVLMSHCVNLNHT